MELASGNDSSKQDYIPDRKRDRGPKEKEMKELKMGKKAKLQQRHSSEKEGKAVKAPEVGLRTGAEFTAEPAAEESK